MYLLHDLEHPQHRRKCRVQFVEVGFCTKAANAQKYKQKNEQHSVLTDLKTFSKMLANAQKDKKYRENFSSIVFL